MPGCNNLYTTSISLSNTPNNLVVTSIPTAIPPVNKETNMPNAPNPLPAIPTELDISLNASLSPIEDASSAEPVPFAERPKNFAP